jgi:hypothetical protein
MTKAQAEFAEYGMSKQQLLDGETDWEGLMGPGPSGNLHGDTGGREPFINYQTPIQQVHITADRKWGDERLAQIFHVEKVEFSNVSKDTGLAWRQAGELADGIWEGIKGIPRGVWGGLKTIGEGYRAIGYYATLNGDKYVPGPSSVTPDQFAHGVYANSPVGMLGAMAGRDYRGAGNRVVGTSVGLAAGYAIPYLKTAPVLGYDVGAGAGRLAWSLGETASLMGESYLARNGLIKFAVEPGTNGSVPSTVHTELVGPIKTGFTADEIAYYRRQTPNQAMRDMVNPVGPKIDPVYGYPVNRLEADHIVPYIEVMEMPGLAGLPRADVIDILNFPGNFMGLGKSTNTSLGAKSWNDWPGHSRLGPVPENVRTNMLQAEVEAREALQRAIQAKKGQ